MRREREREEKETCWVLTLTVIFFWGLGDRDFFEAHETEIVVEELTIVQTKD